MPSIITSLCLRDGACIKVCPVDCIVPGKPVDQYPQYYIDPDSCIECDACIPECPNGAIFASDKLPSAYKAKKTVRFSSPTGIPGFTEVYDGVNCEGEPIHLEATRTLQVGETVDLTTAKAINRAFFTTGPGYNAIES